MSQGTVTIHVAAFRGDKEAMMKLVKAEEDMGYPANETLQKRDGVTGETPLHKAVDSNHEDIVQWLLEKGVMPNAKDNHGVTPLHVAAIRGHLNIVNRLLDSDKSVRKVTDENGDTVVHWAATKGNMDIVDALLSAGAALDVANNQGWTALHRTAFNGRVEVMDRLLNSGASLHAVNQDGNTALHLAAFNNHLGAMGLLLKWGAKTDMRNADGLVPIQMGVSPGVVAIIEEWEIEHPPKNRIRAKLDSPRRPRSPAVPRANTKDKPATPTVGQEKIVVQEVIRRPNSSGSKGPSPPSSTHSATPPDTDMDQSYRRTRSLKTPEEDGASRGPTPKIQPWDLVREHVVRETKQSLRKARGVSSNKKFLKNYNLERFKLFDEQ